MPRVPPSKRNFSLRFWRRPTVVRVGTLGSGVSGLGCGNIKDRASQVGSQFFTITTFSTPGTTKY